MPNPQWDLMTNMKTYLGSVSGFPTVINIVPTGNEFWRPADAGASWVNISVKDDVLNYETGSAYVDKMQVAVTINLDSAAKMGSVHETLLSYGHLSKSNLLRSTLYGSIRRTPMWVGETYTGPDESNIYSVSQTYEYEVQNLIAGEPEAVVGINLGTILVGESSFGTIQIENDGPTALSIYRVTAPTGFTYTAFPTSLASGASGQVAVNLTNTGTAGTYTGDFVIYTNDGMITYRVECVVSASTSIDVLTWKEQTDADITVTVEGLETSEYQFRKANGEVGTSGTEYAGASTGTGKIRVLDSADLSKLERLQLDIRGPVDSRLMEIPVWTTPGAASALLVLPINAFDWVHPDGTIQNGHTCTYVTPFGTPSEKILIRAKAGKTIADIYTMVNATQLTTLVFLSDIIYVNPTAAGGLYQLSCFEGDIGVLADVMGRIAGSFFFADSGYKLYGTLDDWPAIAPSLFYLYYCTKVVGSLKFKAGATTSAVRFYGYGYKGPSYAQMAQTIINYDGCNANSFARGFVCADYKRSLLIAALPGASAAITSLEAKGCTFTFLAE